MIAKILIGLVAGIIILVIVIAMRPSDFRYERTATIAAPVETVFPYVNDLQKWQAWSPWARMDPNAKTIFEGPEAGPGASFHWAGNNQIGEGKMTMTESRQNAFAQFRLEFIKPFTATNTAEFTLNPDGQQTVITWSMYGKNNFMGKAIGLFMDCDKMCGDQFMQGFANLREVLGATPKS